MPGILPCIGHKVGFVRYRVCPMELTFTKKEKTKSKAKDVKQFTKVIMSVYTAMKENKQEIKNDKLEVTAGMVIREVFLRSST